MTRTVGIPCYQVDAFTDRPFGGNPAAVCLLGEPSPDAWMQSVAAEMNLAETAFVLPAVDGFDLRWFTPVVEVDLCGHATLASAHVLWETGRLRADEPARFHTRSGLLTCAQSESTIVLDFPAEREHSAEVPSGLAEALGVEILYTGRNRMDYLVEVADGPILRALQPDFRRLAEISARGIIVTCASDDANFDFLSRFFAPAFGIDEDPGTGSAHCCLGPFWQQRLGRSNLKGYQASRRGAVIDVRMDGDRVKIAGQAVTVLKGQLLAGC
jgi:PhzF family phenazine biosynthesis protein